MEIGLRNCEDIGKTDENKTVCIKKKPSGFFLKRFCSILVKYHVFIRFLLPRFGLMKFLKKRKLRKGSEHLSEVELSMIRHDSKKGNDQMIKCIYVE